MMAFCPKCGNQIPDDCKFCAACGAQLDANAQPAPNVIPPMVDPADHTAEFTKEDISQNKIMAMAAYILGTVGIIIALLAAPQSPYAAFHSRQALKLDILTILLSLVTAVLSWTFIVPIFAGIAALVLLVIRIICFFQVCSGKAKDAAIVGALPFFK